jgi:hypothetical protein
MFYEIRVRFKTKLVYPTYQRRWQIPGGRTQFGGIFPSVLGGFGARFLPIFKRGISYFTGAPTTDNHK